MGYLDKCRYSSRRPKRAASNVKVTTHLVGTIKDMAPSPAASWTVSRGCLHMNVSTHFLVTVSRTKLPCLQKQPGTQLFVHGRLPWSWDNMVSQVSGHAVPHDIYSSPSPHTWSEEPEKAN